ncbi:MAG: transcription termination factor NusA [Chlamydiales bacterium]
MNKDLIAVFEYLEREKGIKREIVVKAIEDSLQAAAQKSVTGASNVTVQINAKTGDIEVYCEKEIVEDVENPAMEISLEEAQELDPDCTVGQFIDVIVTPRDFGRIAAQKARQIINQSLRSAEKDVIFEEYRHRIKELVSGSVKRFVKGNHIIVDLGKVEAIMPMRNYPKTEHYRIGDKVLALLYDVRESENGGAEVILSRSHPEFVEQLFIQEVPEISDGVVTIEKIVRDPGYRTKVIVRSNDSKVDPVGACVGMRGLRVKNIVRELNNEKIDIIPHSDDPLELLQNALDPIQIRKINVNEDEKEICIVVDDEDFAVVIGRRGMNAALNGQLIDYKLDVQRKTDYSRAIAIQTASIAESDDPTLDEPLASIPGVNKLVFEQIIEKFKTPRMLLKASREELAKIPGLSEEMAEMILSQIRNERM